MTYTKEQIKEKISTNQAWLERAVVAIYERQTYEEQQQELTHDKNNVGFSAFDAGYLSYVAKWILEGKHLDGKHLDKVRILMQKYCGQLAEIANSHSK